MVKVYLAKGTAKEGLYFYLNLMNKRTTLTLADSICDLRSRKIKNTFFTQINAILDWFAISVVIGSTIPKVRVRQASRLMMGSCYSKPVFCKEDTGERL